MKFNLERIISASKRAIIMSPVIPIVYQLCDMPHYQLLNTLPVAIPVIGFLYSEFIKVEQ